MDNPLLGITPSDLQQLEHLHVDIKNHNYQILIDNHPQLHELSSVDSPFKKYNIKGIKEPTVFYKWVWGYTQHRELAQIILNHFNVVNRSPSNNVSGTNATLALDAIRHLIDPDSPKSYADYRFSINLDGRKSLGNEIDATRIIDSYFPNIHVLVINNRGRKIDGQEYRNRILECASGRPQALSQAERDSTWANLYSASGLMPTIDEPYLHFTLIDDRTKQNRDALLIWDSENSSTCLRCLADYYERRHFISIDMEKLLGQRKIDWANEYHELIVGIKSFLDDRSRIIPKSDIGFQIVKCASFDHFSDERNTWKRLERDRRKIMGTDGYSTPPGLNGWRMYLQGEYHGRCQLCGDRTPMKQQYAYYWTFRMMGESKNELANVYSNLFCLCPSCHGKMRYGKLMGKDLSELREMAQYYAKQLDAHIGKNDYDAQSMPIARELSQEDCGLNGFLDPIVCNVTVNGERDQTMAFTWNHFMRIAFVYAKANA